MEKTMTPARLFRVSGVAIIVLACSVTSAAQSGNPLTDIQARLSTKFKVTKTAADRSDIVTAGDVVQLHKPGLIMYSVASPLPPSNTYKNGKIGQGMSGFGKDLLIGMLTPGGTTPAQTYPQRQFVPEEKCWMTGIQAQKDGILIQLYSDPYDDIRYYANLKVPFPNKKEVPSVDAALQLVAEVLTVVPPDDQGAQPADQGAQQAPAPSPAQDGPPPPIAGQYLAPGGSHMLLLADGTFTKFVGGGQGHGQYAVDGNNLTLTFASTGFAQHFNVQGGNLVDVNTQQAWTRTGDAPQAPMPDIAPPPPPADTPPPTIALGQNMDQVTAGFGQPLKLAKVGTKTIFYYKDMKVTFTNGKVSNVE
jgi:hypothetical protein